MKIWVDKYKPNKISEIPQTQVTILIKGLIKKNKPILFHGPPGTGKTILAHTLAKEENYEILELNASDIRNKEKINKIIGSSSEQYSLFGKKKLILIDEIDGLSGKKDKGGVQALAKIIPKSNHPIILTTNDPYNSKIKAIKTKCTLLEFTKINATKMHKILTNICKKENIRYSEESINDLINKTKGDIRAAINDLQVYSANDSELDTSDLREREQEVSTFITLQKVFKSEKAIQALLALNNLETDIKDFSLWIEENIPNEYKAKINITKAYHYLSKANIFEARIRKRQHWRFFVYQRTFLSAGINVTKPEITQKFTRYKRGSRPLKIWLHNQKHSLKKEIAKKASSHLHISIKDFIKSFPHYKNIIKNNKEIKRKLRLSTEEIGYLNKN